MLQRSVRCVFRVGNFWKFVWINVPVIPVFRLIPVFPKKSTFRSHKQWKTQPSRIRVLMLSIVSENSGSSVIICAILLQAAIAVV